MGVWKRRKDLSRFGDWSLDRHRLESVNLRYRGSFDALSNFVLPGSWRNPGGRFLPLLPVCLKRALVWEIGGSVQRSAFGVQRSAGAVAQRRNVRIRLAFAFDVWGERLLKGPQPVER